MKLHPCGKSRFTESLTVNNVIYLDKNVSVTNASIMKCSELWNGFLALSFFSLQFKLKYFILTNFEILALQIKVSLLVFVILLCIIIIIISEIKKNKNYCKNITEVLFY